jgi:ATP-dependent DNA helicase RecQ
LELMLKVLDVDGAVRRTRGGWLATGEPWTYDADRYSRVAATRAAEQQAMRTYVRLETCRLRYLREQLDDPWAADCGRCDRCAGPWYPTEVSDTARSVAAAAIERPGVDLEPRAMWPTAMDRLGVDVRGKVDPAERALPGRALARLSDLGWGTRARALVGPGTPDVVVPDDVVAACVEVLRHWGWDTRPAAVVAMPSRSRPLLVGSLAERLSTIGRLPLLGTLAYAHGGPPEDRAPGNSAFRLAAVWDRVVVPPELAAELPAEAPVLLVDDLADSRWTLTVAARALRRAGAAGVLPFVLGVAG